MNLLLTRDELHELTGYARRSDQIRWLERQGWRFVVGADGRAKVGREYAGAMLGTGPANEATLTSEPNWEAL